MKQHRFIFGTIVTVAFILAGISACSIDESRLKEGLRRVSIKATIENGGPDTKVIIHDSLPGKPGRFQWNKDDALAVYVEENGVGTLRITEPCVPYTDNPAIGDFDLYMSEDAARTKFAFYPASSVVGGTGQIGDVPPFDIDSPQVFLPFIYPHSDVIDGGREHHYSPMPMIAVNTEGDYLHFRHLGGLIRLDLAENNSYSSVAFRVAVGNMVGDEFQARRISGPFAIINPNATDISAGNCYIQIKEDEVLTGDNIWKVENLYKGYHIVIRTRYRSPQTLNIPIPTGHYDAVLIRNQESYSSGYTEALYTLGPDGWTCQRGHAIKLSVVINPIDTEYHLDEPQAVELTYTGGTASLRTDQLFKSYKVVPQYDSENPDAKESRPVPYHLEYSEDGTNWSTTAPDWLAANSPSSFAGSVEGEDLTLTMEAQYNTGTDLHRDELAGRLEQGTEENPFDLSTVNVATGATVVRTTANCYVVSAPGFYKFPLVYGNALKDNLPNDAAFHRQQNTSTDATFPEYLVDHSGASITQPYIAQQPSVSGTLSARVIWTDAIGLVKNVGVSGSGQNAYINFEVPVDRICQGNALVAVFAGDVIVWSWHIWVTDEDLSVNKDVGSSRFSPVNLGWCEGRTEIYAERTCQVRAVQDAPGVTDQNQKVTDPVTVTRTGASIQTLGNNPYYQWGRKDPMQAANCIDGFKVYYSDYAAPDIVTGSATVGESIQAPYSFYAGAVTGSWCSDGYVNLWNTLETTKSAGNSDLDDVSKTVYDPCPVGYEVGSLYSWTPLNGVSITTWVPASGTNPAGREYPVNGLFFPAIGARDGYDGGVDAHHVSYGDYWVAQHKDSFVGHGASVLDNGLEALLSRRANMNVGMSIRPIKQSFTVTGEGLINWD